MKKIKHRPSRVDREDAAVALGRRFPVIACRPDDYEPYTERASSAAGDIRGMWKRWPDAAAGVRTGEGLVVVVDARRSRRAEPDPSLPTTLTARGPEGVWQYFYRCTTPVSSVAALLPGLSLRGRNDHVIVPPTAGWSWHNDAPLAELPDAIKVAASRVRGESI